MKKLLTTLISTILLLCASSAQTLFTDVQISSGLTMTGGAPFYLGQGYVMRTILSGDGRRSLLMGFGSNDDNFSIGFGNAIGSGDTALRIIGNSNFSDGSYNSTIVGSGNLTGNAVKMSIIGSDNFVDAGDDRFDAVVLGNGNQIYAARSVILGHGNSIGFSSSRDTKNVYMLGYDLLLSPNQAVGGVVLVGGCNADDLDLSNVNAGESPCFVVGSGIDSAHRANALVVLKNGHMTIINKEYIQPTSGAPNPAQPETLLVKGSATILGDLNLTRRQGDIWMGSFGRAEDQGPSN